MFRNRLFLFVLLLAAIAAGLALWRLGDREPALGRVVSSGHIAVGGPFQLIDQNGRPVSDRDLHGRYALIYFGYSFCPDVCPTTLAVMADALDRLGPAADRIVPVFITVDPARDTPKVLKSYMAAFGPRFVGLTGSPAAIAEAEKAFHVYARKRPPDGAPGGAGAGYAVDHSSVLYLMGPDGKPAGYYDDAIAPADLAASLEKAVR